MDTSEEKVKLDLTEVEAPTTLDGDPVDKEEAAKVHAHLKTGEMTVKILPEVEEKLRQMGISPDELKALLIRSTGKTLS